MVEDVMRDAQASATARASRMSSPAQQAPLRFTASPWS
jgi:hypothetical protein